MTPEEQRIALAEWAKYVELDYETQARILYGRLGSRGALVRIPDYLNDLNAVHELEEKLRKNSYAWAKYGEQLQEVVNHYPVGFVPDYHRDLRSLASVAHATAAQRCEAILKTLNIWKP
jgi:hypothetical protein